MPTFPHELTRPQHEAALADGLAAATRAAMGAKLNPADSASARLFLAVAARLLEDEDILFQAAGTRLGIMQRASADPEPEAPEAA